METVEEEVIEEPTAEKEAEVEPAQLDVVASGKVKVKTVIQNVPQTSIKVHKDPKTNKIVMTTETVDTDTGKVVDKEVIELTVKEYMDFAKNSKPTTETKILETKVITKADGTAETVTSET